MTDSRPRRRRSIQDLPIRSKQTLVLLLPTVALLVLGAILTTSSRRRCGSTPACWSSRATSPPT